MLDKTSAYIEATNNDWTDPEMTMLLIAAKSEVTALRTLPQIVCLCGSTRFKGDILAASETMTMQGHIVLAPNVFGRELEDEGKDDHVLVSPEQKGLLDALHFRKIDLADRVHVLNVGGYIGESTHKEITYAVRVAKLITFSGEKVIPWDTKHKEPVSVAHYMTGVRARVAAEG